MSAAAGAAIGALIAAGAQMYGQAETNNANAGMANASNQFQRESAILAHRMGLETANTAHQRQVQDLKSAGLNPILSATGGAPSPQASASSASPAKFENPMSGLLTSALEAKRIHNEQTLQKEQISNIKAQTAKTLVDAEVARKGIPESELKNDMFDVFRPWVKKIKEGLQTDSSPSQKDNWMEQNIDWEKIKQNKPVQLKAIPAYKP